ncbi:MAG: bacteriohopanetetrol glucosamine biosynthesis glycosyltransferase HpnI [Drouetiella hepatica Uher 2000/2452]|jgi:ceramide glucosyltransferase|uniref:Bacteriohopanetetrol glucosamine biosynthesis glycosyltransferase HpnI n=1 Tax=Drouetiella hepatica Uher 2000/2452 TaxID=904376 RepID=A0A951QAE8_9CYAN|nr:bacteriohopanetetrol glucosamine biosynthesis glycosyltransferase HpnI [Drouetiella hepatica Uher 2000/2452]
MPYLSLPPLAQYSVDVGWNIIGDSILFLLLGLALSSIAYYGYAITAAIQFLSRSSNVAPDFHPPISILKPVCGLSDQLYENLASFCQQDYPDYQLIFGVQDQQDPSIKVVRQLMDNFPDLDMRLIVNHHTIGTNRKVCNLANALIAAEHEVLLLADSDVRVEPNYLREIVQPLSDAKVGVVTCLYRSLTQGWVTTLEALGTATDFHPGVLVSTQLEGTRFAMGQTILMRQSVLREIGGFEAIADYLADDFQLGYLPTQIGYQVVLSTYVVEHVLPTSTFAASWQRQLRWMLCIRVSRAWGYVGLIFTYGTVTSLVFLLATGGSHLGWGVLSLAWISRLVVAWLVGVKILKDAATKRWLWLVPLRDLLSFALWCYSFVGNTFEWSDRRLKTTKEGKLVSLPILDENVKSVG